MLSSLFCFVFLTEPDLFEGDIVKTPDLDRRIKGLEFEAKNPDVAADAIRNGEWPNAVVPYTFARGFSKFSRNYKMFKTLCLFSFFLQNDLTVLVF